MPVALAPAAADTDAAAPAPLFADVAPPVFPFPEDVHLVALNQAGFERDGPKRFTAPRSPDGTRFEIRLAASPDAGSPSIPGSAALFTGEIRGQIGDFSAFRPEDENASYLVEIPAGFGLRAGSSDPFVVRERFWQDLFWEPAVNFMIDVRSIVGTHPSAYGGQPWRDGTYYDFCLPALVLLHLADPERLAALPRQIDWTAERARVLAPDFPYVPEQSAGPEILAAVRRYFTDIPPPAPDATDVEKMIHWAAGFLVTQPESEDLSGGDQEGYKIHLQTLEQLAYVLWAWPSLARALPAVLHERIADLVFSHWVQAGGFDVSKWWDPATYQPDPSLLARSDGPPTQDWLHPYKGRHGPGHSIVPNILLHEVALRLGRPDAAAYLDAAVAQAAWIVARLDWNDPRATKGQRLAEPRTIPSLVWLLQRHPERAPAGLREKIASWAELVVARADNLWDYRRYDLERHWSIPVLNDIGNLLGFPASALSAASVLEDRALADRLRVLATAQVDAALGRNPRFAASPHRNDFGFSGLKRGWHAAYRADVCARLELCRGAFASAPCTEMYPFNPYGKDRHLEGWNVYGAAWCASLAWFRFDRLGHSPAHAFPPPSSP